MTKSHSVLLLVSCSLQTYYPVSQNHVMVDGLSASQPASQSLTHSVLVSQHFWSHVQAVPIKVNSNVISMTQGQPENRENPHRKFLLRSILPLFLRSRKSPKTNTKWPLELNPWNVF